LTRGERRSSVAGPAGRLEVAFNVPEGSLRGIALIAHPHPLQGGTLDNKVVQTLAKTFAALGYAAIRFNFRGVGQSVGQFDDGIGETDDALAALAAAKLVQTRVAHAITAERLVLIGPAVKRFPVEAVAPDTIVIHGEEDDVVALADVLAWARPQQLPIMVFPGCGHFFHGRLPQLQRVITGMWKK